jgi:hypothetical protein
MGAERLLDWGNRVVAVDLIEVDIVDLEAAETGLHAIHDVLAGSAYIVGSGTNTGEDLGGDDNFVAGDVQILERLPEGLLTFTLLVIVCGIEVVDTPIVSTLDQFVGPVLVRGTVHF